MPRPKHPIKELEALLAEAERKGWSVAKGKKYYKMRCGPGHRGRLKTVYLTPSDPYYETNLRRWLKRTGCWED